MSRRAGAPGSGGQPSVYAIGDTTVLGSLAPGIFASGAVAVSVGNYPDGEIRLDLRERPNEASVVACSLHDDATGRFSTQRLLWLLATAAALREHGARRIVGVAPEIPCLRQDAPTPATYELSAGHWVKRLLADSALDAMATVHPKEHVGDTRKIVGLRYAELAGALRRHLVAIGAHVDVVLTPDVGARRFGTAVAEELGRPLATTSKSRIAPDEVCIAEDFLAAGGGADLTYLVVDDMYVSGATVLSVARTLGGAGHSMWAYVSNFRPTCLGLRRLRELKAIPGFNGLLAPHAGERRCDVEPGDVLRIVSLGTAFERLILELVGR